MPEKKQYFSPVNGQPLPRGRQFTSETAREARRIRTKNEAAQKTLRDGLFEELSKVKETKDGRKITARQAMCEAAVAQSLKNPRFWELIRDTIGEKPTDKIDFQHKMKGDFIIKVTGDMESDADY